MMVSKEMLYFHFFWTFPRNLLVERRLWG